MSAPPIDIAAYRRLRQLLDEQDAEREEREPEEDSLVAEAERWTDLVMRALPDGLSLDAAWRRANVEIDSPPPDPKPVDEPVEPPRPNLAAFYPEVRRHTRQELRIEIRRFIVEHGGQARRASIKLRFADQSTKALEVVMRQIVDTGAATRPWPGMYAVTAAGRREVQP